MKCWPLLEAVCPIILPVRYIRHARALGGSATMLAANATPGRCGCDALTLVALRNGTALTMAAPGAIGECSFGCYNPSEDSGVMWAGRRCQGLFRCGTCGLIECGQKGRQDTCACAGEHAERDSFQQWLRQAHAETPAPANTVLAVAMDVSTPVYGAGRAAECRHLLSRRAAAPAKHDMNDVTILLARLALGIPFSYVHFNEGEVRAALHATGAVPNGAQRFSPALREAMRAAMNASHPNLYAGVPCRAEFPREHLSALQLVSTESARRTAATVFINGNFPLLMTAKGGLFVDLLRRRAQGGHSLHLVASEAADVARFSTATRLVPKTVVRTPRRDSFARRDNVSREALSQFGDGDIVIVCTGALGRILVTEWTRLRPQTTFLELGSFFDPEFGFRALAYHRQVRGGAPWAPGCGSKHDRTATSMAPLQQCLKLYTGA